ncbi:response regulator [Streptomyces sp. NPDC059629]|uniref:response regulator transcription factor n=1 Tax=Streptomyces sp. NPDC059629 TaxID=3346889 RepID=UPI0036C97EA2
MTIRVLLADDQALLRATFRILIDSCDDTEVVGEAADGAEAVALTRELRPDIVLIDIRMPGTDGLAATAAVCADPELSGVRVLILTTFEVDEYVAQALRFGAGGFLGKDVTAEALLAGIRTVAAGESLLSPTATRTLITRFLAAPAPAPGARLAAPEQLRVLTARERQVTALAAQGRSNEEIAGKLFVSPLTVRTHIHRAMTKLDVRDRAQLVVMAYQSGLVQPPPAGAAEACSGEPAPQGACDGRARSTSSA